MKGRGTRGPGRGTRDAGRGAEPEGAGRKGDFEGRGTRDEGRGTEESNAVSGSRMSRKEVKEPQLIVDHRRLVTEGPPGNSAAYTLPACEYSIVAESGPVRNFEDLIAWQKARQLAQAVYQVTKQRPFAQDFGLASQIQRAAVSVMSNIAEGHERGSTNEFHHFLSNAKGSCAEVRCQLYVALDVGYLDEAQFRGLMAQAIEVGRIGGGLRAAIGARRK